jgi:drug/metabolite transporter (DMT)-like permease
VSRRKPGYFTWKESRLSSKNWLKFILLGLIWGSSFLWIKIAGQELDPFLLVNFRIGFAVLGLTVAIVVAHTQIKHTPNSLLVFALLGLFNVALPFVLISWAEKYISSGVASILNSSSPLFTIIIAPLFLKEEHLSLPKIAGLLVGFGGVVLLMSNQINGGLNDQLLGIIAMLLASLSYAISAIFARRFTIGMDASAQAFSQMVFALFWITPISFAVVHPYHLPELPITWIAVAWLGLLGSCVATMMYYSLLHSVGPTRTMLTNYIFPLVGVILGVAFLGETPDWRHLAGGVLIISGIVIVNSKFKRLPHVSRSS